ncbi:MAG: excinuclease ABC subunit UvrA [Sphingobacteriaceae bacterium]|nr:excinuclease ABC subunit UvrA [Sphingobacteriaceae bacterium]
MENQEPFTSPETHIEVYGAREHNLKNIDVSIPRNQLVVITGLSGSGKSSLAFETIYAEGQRRYMESFSAYARQFIGDMERPDVDKIEGLSPVISIEQKTTGRNPRSTVGTITEVYDFMRLLYARVGEAYSYVNGKRMQRFTEQQIEGGIAERFAGKKIALLAPLVRARKGHYRELFEQMRKQGYLKIRVDGEVLDLQPKMQVDRYKVHDIELVIDRLIPTEEEQKRLKQSIQQSLRIGKGTMLVLDYDANEISYFSRFLMDPESGIAYDEPQPNSFSFNSPYGACETCDGLGTVAEIDPALIMPDPALSITAGGLAPLGEYRDIWAFRLISAASKKFKFSLTTPVGQLSNEARQILLFGSEEALEVPGRYDDSYGHQIRFEGLVNLLKKQQDDASSISMQSWAEEYVSHATCPTCKGGRLKQEALHYRIKGKNIAELSAMEINELTAWFEGIDDYFTGQDALIAHEILKEIRVRLGFLNDIGLSYLSLHRGANTLSGGESQRIRLATQIGSQLVGVLYILDEPSIGLHQRDNQRLIGSLKRLRDAGNTVLVVEHDEDMIRESDYVLDIGPGAGRHGGQVVGAGKPADFLKLDTLTAQYLRGEKGMPKISRTAKAKQFLRLFGASGNNLKKVDVSIPLGQFICVTGVSGSGKSTLINETLYPILSQHLYGSRKKPLPYTRVEGLEHIDKVIEIDQTPIGRTPRSNPSTYTTVFSDIRTLFAELPEAKIRGYKPGRFSFNVKGGRCEECGGAGVRLIEMNFLPDVQVHCESCQGRRYNRETLEVRYRGKSISDVLDMSIDEAVVFFENMPNILRKIKTLQDVGLGYLTLGQPSTTLSGGEAQRVKLASELSKKDTGSTFYILDEPTTGLHFEDVRVLLEVLHKLVDRGNTVLVIEHNLDVIRTADYIVDIGPDGGRYGGQVVYSGDLEAMRMQAESITAQFI